MRHCIISLLNHRYSATQTSSTNDPSSPLGEVPLLSTCSDIDASLRKGEILKEWVTKKVSEGDVLLDEAEDKLRQMHIMKREGQILETLGESVL
jgi:hypothetical protein